MFIVKTDKNLVLVQWMNPGNKAQGFFGTLLTVEEARKLLLDLQEAIVGVTIKEVK